VADQAQTPQTPQERRQEQRQQHETAYQQSRRLAQEAENKTQLAKGTRSMGEAERALRRSMKSFMSVRLPRGSRERQELGYLLSQVEDALQALRRARRGSLVDFSDPDLAMGDQDLEV